MRKIVKDFFCRAAAQPKFLQFLHGRILPNRLTILVYHGIVRVPLKVDYWCFVHESEFRRQMIYLREHFQVLPLSEAIERLANGDIQQPTAVVTFDDGYQNNYDVAFPILCQEQIPATVFLATALVDTNDTLWFARLNEAVANTSRPVLEWNDARFDFTGAESKNTGLIAIRSTLKRFAPSQLRAELCRILAALGEDPDRPIEATSPFRMLSRKAVTAMAASGLIEFGAHTHTHTILTRLSPDEQRKEIKLSVSTVEQLTGRSCNLFAYPNGRPQDYNACTMKLLDTVGIRAAVTGIEGPNTQQTPLMELRRYGIGSNPTPGYFQLKAHHFHHYFIKPFSRGISRVDSLQ